MDFKRQGRKQAGESLADAVAESISSGAAVQAVQVGPSGIKSVDMASLDGGNQSPDGGVQDAIDS